MILINGEYGDLSLDTNTGTYLYVPFTDGSDNFDQNILALNNNESVQEVFIFSTIDANNARDNQYFTVTIDGRDNDAQFVITKGGTEGVYGAKTITGSFTLKDFEDNLNVMSGYDLNIEGTPINMANGAKTLITTDEGVLTITMSGNTCNYSYNIAGKDADTGGENVDGHMFDIVATNDEGMVLNKTLNFNINQKQAAISGSKSHTVTEGSAAIITGNLSAGRLTGLLAGDVVLASSYVNGKMAAVDTQFWNEVLKTNAHFADIVPESFGDSSNIETFFDSDAGQLAFYNDGSYRFEASDHGAVSQTTSFTFAFEDFALQGVDASNYQVVEPVFTLTIKDDPSAIAPASLESDDSVAVLTAAPMADPTMASEEGEPTVANLVNAGQEFTIDNLESLYTDLVQGSSGNDLITIDLSLQDIVVEDVIGIDGGEGMDVLLSGIENLDIVKDLILEGKVADMEVIIAGEASGANANEVLENLGIVDDDNDGKLDLEDYGWTKAENATTPSGYVEYKSEDEETTILVQQTLLSN